MQRLRRTAVLLKLAESLDENHSWCGETHLQKAAFFLQAMLQVPIGFNFILYKHGPFSFDLRDELSSMTTDQLMELKPRRYPYAPSLGLTETGHRFLDRFPRTIQQYKERIEFVAEKLGSSGVAELERLATALHVTNELGEDISPDERARRLNELKPHVSLDAAASAVRKVDEYLQEARSLRSAD